MFLLQLLPLKAPFILKQEPNTLSQLNKYLTALRMVLLKGAMEETSLQSITIFSPTKLLQNPHIHMSVNKVLARQLPELLLASQLTTLGTKTLVIQADLCPTLRETQLVLQSVPEDLLSNSTLKASFQASAELAILMPWL